MTTTLTYNEDHEFWDTILSPDPRLIQLVAPTPNPHIGNLDVQVHRGVLLVIYGAGTNLVVARGTDLVVMMIIDVGFYVRAVSMRGGDGGVCVGGDGGFIVYKGWWKGGSLWEEVEIWEGGGGIVEMVSWSRDGGRLGVVGEKVCVWEKKEDGRFGKVFEVGGEEDGGEFAEKGVLFGRISPDGALVVVARRFSEFGWVYQVGERKKDGRKGVGEEEGGEVKVAELGFGKSGVSALDWKPRGGGLPGLVSVDSDGTLRLWARILPHTSPVGSFMEEVARSPHVPSSCHASAGFLQWGGGGGVGDDEADATAALSHGFVDFPMAPKPSRCHQWIVCYAAGDAVAWRVRGLDDRPRAQYTRLEPGCGQVPFDDRGDDSPKIPSNGNRRKRTSLKEMSGTMLATKAVSAIPLPTSSPQVAGMVKSYAISNGERRLRSPEPPEAPRHASLFTLSAQETGKAYIARYDTCPTTADEPLERCGSFPGHSTAIKELSAASRILVSTGIGGDVVVWRVDPSATSTQPLRPISRLPSAFSAAVALNSICVAAVETETTRLSVYRFGKNKAVTTFEGRHPCIAQGEVATLLALKADSCGSDCEAHIIICIAQGGHEFSAHILESETQPRACATFIKGRRFGKVTAAVSHGSVIAIGSVDGCVRLYRVAVIGDSAHGGISREGQENLGRTVVLEEINFLGESDGSDAEITALSIDGSHVCAVREDGSFVVWSYKAREGCHLELTVAGKGDDVSLRRVALETNSNDEKRLYVSERSTLQVYRLRNTSNWILDSVSEVGVRRGKDGKVGEKDEKGEEGVCEMEYLASGIVALSFDSSIAIYNLRTGQSKISNPRTWRVDELLAVALLGQGADVIRGALEELAALVDSAANKELKPSYRGKGLPLPPPSLNILTGGSPSDTTLKRESSENEDKLTNETPSKSEADLKGALGITFAMNGGTKRNLFLELMKRGSQEESAINGVAHHETLEGTDKLMRLKVRLKTVSIEGVDQIQKYCLGCLAQACSLLTSVLGSLDRPGKVFALFGELYIATKGRVPIPDSVAAFALHSSAADALADHFFFKTAGGGGIEGFLWDKVKLLGGGFWVQSLQLAKKLAERIARLSFAATRNADTCAIWFVALGRLSALSSLYMTQQNLRMGKFLKRDFSEVANQEAAAKNAYVLVSKHRLELAAAFFILAGDVRGGLNLIRTRLHDEQLAIFLARIIHSGDFLQEVLNDVSKRALDDNEVHRLAIVQCLSGRFGSAIKILRDAKNDSKEIDRVDGQDLTFAVRETARGLGAQLPKSVYVASHLLALSNRPSLRGNTNCLQAVEQIRARAISDLVLADYHLAAVCVLLNDLQNGHQACVGTQKLQSIVSTMLSRRSVAHASATRAGTGADGLAKAIEADLAVLKTENQSLAEIIRPATQTAVLKLAGDDETDAAIAVAVTGRAGEELHEAIHVASSRAVSRALCALSKLHRPDASSTDLELLVAKMKTAIHIALDFPSKGSVVEHHKIVRELKKAAVVVNFGIAFLRGSWSYLLEALRSCEGSPSPILDTLVEVGMYDDNGNDKMSVSLESLRYVASNPAVYNIFHDSTQRRVGKIPSMSLVEFGAAATSSLNTGAENGNTSTNVSTMSLLKHPLLSSALGSVVVAYLSTHSASSAASLEPYLQRCLSGCGESSHFLSDKSRLLLATEELEHVAADALSGWIPLAKFGSQHTQGSDGGLKSTNAFVELWGTLGCLPEYARTLSDAATVAAAESASAAVQTLSPQKARKQFDTDSAEYLFGAYPIRFSTGAISPWSGRGRHTGLYREKDALFRTLCLSASDPPAIIVATPRGIQEIVPSSYTTVPSGFRSHYGNQHGDRGSIRSLASLEESSSDYEAVYSLLDHEIERPVEYQTLDLKNAESSSGSAHGGLAAKYACMRPEVEATALAAHPLKRRFATGGTDGNVRLWEYGDPISSVALRMPRFGRVSDVSFSSYGSALLAVYASGHVALWRGASINRRSYSAKSSKKGEVINAFNSRRASGGVFLDEGKVIAVIGDPTAPPNVGHSLRVFDTREPHVEFRAAMSMRVHDGGEATCLALLDDRVRVVTGGEDGSLCIVDLRNRPCVVSRLPAHNDEVICLSLEAPRGRALASGCRDGDIKLWDARTLRELDHILMAHEPTRHYWSGSGIGGLVGMHGVQSVALTDRSLISCGGDGVVKIWGPGWGDYDLNIV